MDGQCSAVVHFVDDDPEIQDTLLNLAQRNGIAARAYPSAIQFLAEINLDAPGCLVVDLQMPDMDGLDLLKRLRGLVNPLPVILLSGQADVPAAVQAMKLGATDVLQKPFDPNQLIYHIRQCLQSSSLIHQERKQQRSVRGRFTDLTPRESELLKLVVDGRSNKQIALQLGISIKTVANHRARLMAKTHASNAADLARMFTIVETRSFPVQIARSPAAAS